MRDWVVAACTVGVAVVQGCGTTADIHGVKTDDPSGMTSDQAGAAGTFSGGSGGRPALPGSSGAPGRAGSVSGANGGTADCSADCTVATGGAAGDDGGSGGGGSMTDAATPVADASARPCRPDLCPIASNCCAPDGSCGNDYGEGCISNGQRPRECEVTVDVVTVTAGGKYAPRNDAATWVQSSSGQFEKTLSQYGRVTMRSLVYWTSVSGLNMVDAVTGATRANHGPLHATWDCTDASEAEVPDGTYEVCATFAEAWCNDTPSDCPSSLMRCVPFEKGPAAATVRAPDTANFTGFVVSYK